MGNYFYYYKCQHTEHNNISAVKAHEQLQTALEYMSLPYHLVTAIRDKSELLLADREKDNKKLLDVKRESLTRRKNSYGQSKKNGLMNK